MIGGNLNRKESWIKVVDTMKDRLSRWKDKHLSFGGRTVLLKFVLYVILVYFLSFFKDLTGIISNLESIFKKYL